MRKVANLDRRKSLYVHARKALLQTPYEIEVIIKRQIRMQTTHNVEFRHCF